MTQIFKTKNEKRLALILGTALGVVACLAITRGLLDTRARLAGEVQALQAERDQAKILLEDRPLWHQREIWLDVSQPELSDARQESAEILSAIETAAQKSGLQVNSKAIEEAENGKFFTGLPIRVQATGDIHALAVLLLQYQKPGNFVMVRGLTVKAAATEGLVDCDIEFVRCYIPARQATAQR